MHSPLKFLEGHQKTKKKMYDLNKYFTDSKQKDLGIKLSHPP